METSSGFLAQPHLRIALHLPICHFNSHLAHVQFLIRHALNQWPGTFSKQEEKLAVTYLVSRSQSLARFDAVFGCETYLFQLSWEAVRCLSSSQDGGITWPFFFFARTNSSSRDALTFVVAVKTIIGANYFVWMMDWCYLPENPHVTRTDWLPENWDAHDKTVKLKQKR